MTIRLAELANLAFFPTSPPFNPSHYHPAPRRFQAILAWAQAPVAALLCISLMSQSPPLSPPPKVTSAPIFFFNLSA